MVQATEWGWSKINNVSELRADADCWVLFEDAYIDVLPALPAVGSNSAKLAAARSILTAQESAAPPQSAKVSQGNAAAQLIGCFLVATMFGVTIVFPHFVKSVLYAIGTYAAVTLLISSPVMLNYYINGPEVRPSSLP